MPSQEDYLDKLLKGIDGSASAEEDTAAAGTPDLGDLAGMDDVSDIGILSDLGDLPDIGVMPDLGDLPDIGEIPDVGDFFDLDDLPSLEDLPDIGALLNMSELSGDGEASSADELLSGVDELLSGADELPSGADELSSDTDELSGGDVLSELAGLGDMSEEDVEQALQANRAEQQVDDAVLDVGDEDLMNLLEAADNSELQDIHDMLQKSDNNETLDEGVLNMGSENSEAGESAAQALSGAEEGDGLSERQRKALEKKQLKEEKAAAKKAAKEAKKAAKLAKKAGKSQEEVQQGGDTVPGSQNQVAGERQEQSGSGEGGAADLEDALSVDMSAIDDLLELDDAPGGLSDVSKAGAVSDIPSNGKKKGLFARILDFLTEEDEDEEEEQKEKGTENIPLSDENKNILAEMDKEEPGKKGKKGKKPKKAKKGKAGAADAENEGEGDEEAGGKKAKKAKKPPKEKKPKEDVPKGPKKKFPIKQLMPIVLTCVTVLFVILLLVNLGGDFTVKRNARQAYYQEDYETCYQELYGRTLNESEQVMFGKSESILRIRLWMREYELFSGEGAEVEALDILIQSVKDYAPLHEYAVKWNADAEVSAIYQQMLGILQDKYGLTEAQALEIAAEPDDVEYTKLVTAAAQGQGYHPGGVPSGPVELPHMLPEEKQFPENNGGQ